MSWALTENRKFHMAAGNDPSSTLSTLLEFKAYPKNFTCMAAILTSHEKSVTLYFIISMESLQMRLVV